MIWLFTVIWARPQNASETCLILTPTARMFYVWSKFEVILRFRGWKNYHLAGSGHELSAVSYMAASCLVLVACLHGSFLFCGLLLWLLPAIFIINLANTRWDCKIHKSVQAIRNQTQSCFFIGHLYSLRSLRSRDLSLSLLVEKDFLSIQAFEKELVQRKELQWNKRSSRL